MSSGTLPDCTELVYRSHIPCVLEVHPCLDHSVANQEGDVVLAAQRWAVKAKVPHCSPEGHIVIQCAPTVLRNIEDLQKEKFTAKAICITLEQQKKVRPTSRLY